MKEEKKKLISFQIHRVETLQYAVLQDVVNAEELSLQAGFGFGIDSKDCFIRCSFDYTFISENKPVLKLEVAIEFKVKEDCYQTEINKEKQWVIPKGFATHIAMVVVGAARGILHEKTKGTELNKFHMPVINVMGAIKDDVVIEKES